MVLINDTLFCILRFSVFCPIFLCDTIMPVTSRCHSLRDIFSSTAHWHFNRSQLHVASDHPEATKSGQQITNMNVMYESWPHIFDLMSIGKQVLLTWGFESGFPMNYMTKHNDFQNVTGVHGCGQYANNINKHSTVKYTHWWILMLR